MALKEVLALFSFQIEGIDDLDAADQKTTTLTKSVQALGGILAGAGILAIGKGIFDFASGAADAADATDKFATAIGANARDVAEWDTILGNAGVELASGRNGLKTFTKISGEAAKGNKDLQKTFRTLGVRAKDSRGQLRPFNDRLTDTVLGLEKIEDPAKRAAEAEKLFGEAGLGFVRVALDGADALAAQRQEFEDLFGGGAFEKFTEDSKKAAVAGDRWRNATSALRVVIASALIPILTRVVVWIAKMTRSFAKLVRGTKIVEVTLATLGAVAALVAGKILIAFAPVILTFAVFAAAIGGTILIIEDLFQLFTGGESLIGRFLEKTFGVRETELLVESTKEAVGDLIDAFVRAGEVILPVLKDVLGVLGKIIKTTGKVIGTLGKVGEFIGENVGGPNPAEILIAREKAKQKRARDARRQRAQERETFGVELSPEALDARRQASLALSARAGQERQQGLARSITIPGTGTRAPITVNAPTQITLQGAGDPNEAARLVMAALDDREQTRMRRARDLALAR